MSDEDSLDLCLWLIRCGDEYRRATWWQRRLLQMLGHHDRAAEFYSRAHEAGLLVRAVQRLNGMRMQTDA